MEHEKELLLEGASGPSTDAQDTSKQKPIEENPQPPSPNALKVAATECLNNWICYLQILNSVCTAGLRLSQSLHTLSQSQNIPLATQCHTNWDEFVKATSFATHTVKNHIASAMQDMIIGETFTEDDAQRQQVHNQQIVTENLLTFINLQYQFSLAGCEIFGTMASCPSCHSIPGAQHVPDCTMATLQQCFSQIYAQEMRSQTSSPHNMGLDRNLAVLDSPKGPEFSKFYSVSTEFPRQQSPEQRSSSPYHETLRGSSPDAIKGPGHIETIRGPFPNPGHLYTMKSPFPGRNSRSALHFPLFPLIGQRRWSEAAAAGTVAGETTAEGGDGSMRRWSMPWDCGRVETAPWQQRYLPTKLTVPSVVAGTSQERSRSNTPETQPNQPGTLPSSEGLAEAIQLLSCRPMRCSIPFAHTPHPGPYGTSVWTDPHEDRIHRRGHGGPLQRGIWQSIDVPPSCCVPNTEHFDIFPPGLPLTSRKSSSSTDSSSCLSIHSRSTTSSSEKASDSISSGGGDAVRLHTNFYSIWSGSDHLPFIKLPESQEPQEEDSDPEDGEDAMFPKPT